MIYHDKCGKMKQNDIVIRRFDELDAKINNKLVQKWGSITAYATTHEYVDSAAFHEWSASVLNLLHGVFGAQSNHYVLFNAQYLIVMATIKFWLENCLQCCAIFRAAREDYTGSTCSTSAA